MAIANDIHIFQCTFPVVLWSGLWLLIMTAALAILLNLELWIMWWRGSSSSSTLVRPSTMLELPVIIEMEAAYQTPVGWGCLVAAFTDISIVLHFSQGKLDV